MAYFEASVPECQEWLTVLFMPGRGSHDPEDEGWIQMVATKCNPCFRLTLRDAVEIMAEACHRTPAQIRHRFAKRPRALIAAAGLMIVQKSRQQFDLHYTRLNEQAGKEEE